LPERPREKTSAEIKKEQKAARLAEGKRLANELDSLFGLVRGRFAGIEKTGVIPEEGVLRGLRKNVQYLSSGLRRLRDSGADASFSQSQLNVFSSKLNKLMSGEQPGAKAGGGPRAGTARTAGAATTTGPKLDELLQRVRRGSGGVSDPALQEIIILLKAIAKKKIMNEETLLVAERAKKLMHERKRSELEIDNFLKDKFVEPVLSAIFDAFLKKLEIANIVLPRDTINYIETCVKGGKSRKEFINLLLERQPGMHLLD